MTNSTSFSERRTRRWIVEATCPAREALDEAARILRQGGLVAMPTETVYGLAVDATNTDAVDALYRAKGRPSENPLIVHVEDAASARRLVATWPTSADLLADAFWPGPITLVLMKNGVVVDRATAGGPTVALRAPAHHVARALLTVAGMPLAAPSANRSQSLSPTTADHVFKELDGRIDLVLDAGPTSAGVESTVVDLTGEPRILRPGPITATQIAEVLGVACLATPDASVKGPLKSPGMMARHYAPRAKLTLSADVAGDLEQLMSAGHTVGCLICGPLPELVGVRVVAMPADPSAYAARLYAALHELDDAGVDRIVVEMPPAGEAWSAIRDRLDRASG
jgi:L-threonylcarbamoyladenylate synthase